MQFLHNKKQKINDDQNYENIINRNNVYLNNFY